MDRDRHDPVIKSALLQPVETVPQADGDGEFLKTFSKELLPAMRLFETGAIRDLDNSKYDYEAFLSPLVIEGYAAYMHKNRHLKDGSVRDGDNWQKGIPLKTYVKSAWRHFFAFWKAHRSGKPFTDLQIEETYAILFNIMGYLYEIEKKRQTP